VLVAETGKLAQTELQNSIPCLHAVKTGAVSRLHQHHAQYQSNERRTVEQHEQAGQRLGINVLSAAPKAADLYPRLTPPKRCHKSKGLQRVVGLDSTAQVSGALGTLAVAR